MKKALFIALLAVSCRKDYSLKPSPFYVGEKVELNRIDPEKSPVPVPGGVATLVIFHEYTVVDQRFWYYDTVDANGDTLLHVDNKQLKKY